MADIATETALQHLKSLYPYGKITSSSDGNSYETLIMDINTQCDFLVIRNPWYLITLASFAAGNRPDAVPLLFKDAFGGLLQIQNQFNSPVTVGKPEKILLTCNV